MIGKNDKKTEAVKSEKTQAVPCTNCDGRGVLPEVDPTKYCPVCDGSGFVEEAPAK
jgi:DnaJ-class molecular chaperone